MITTEECKRIAKIMWDGGPKIDIRIDNIIYQLQLLADAVRVNFSSVYDYLKTLQEEDNWYQKMENAIIKNAMPITESSIMKELERQINNP